LKTLREVRSEFIVGCLLVGGAVKIEQHPPDRQAVDLLRQTLSGVPQPWRVSWAGLVSLEPDGVTALAELVAQWACQPVKLQFAQVDCLERILDARTADGDRSIDPTWWRLRLDWLRAMRRCDEFELVALDYCVTYEVSPPAWDLPLCEAVVLTEDGEACDEADPGAFESRLSALGDMRASDLSGWGTSAFIPPVVGELFGTLTGDAVEALSRLSAHVGDVNPVIVSCGQLERIDFEAAIAIMNWVAARQVEGREVHLTEVHRLISALLGALGLAEQARITLRYD
jgi:ABC-type transporter Mla MlaB component